MAETNLLMAKIIYGCGLRLRECVNLRVKYIDFERSAVTVHGKGDKVRETVLPESIKKELREHLEKVRAVCKKEPGKWHCRCPVARLTVAENAECRERMVLVLGVSIT